LPIYWGNRNWYPLLADEIQRMTADGVTRALAFVTSAYSSYSGCRQYREDIESARRQVGQAAPQVDKLRVFYNHPSFIRAWVSRLQNALEQVPRERRDRVSVMYTAHSIPLAMAATSDYQQQLQETATLVSDTLGIADWRLVYQSRSGPPHQKWLEPDVCDAIRALRDDRQGEFDLVIAPIGFLSDHLEVLYDLDIEARDLCEQLGVHLVRAGTVGTHPDFVGMIADLIGERLNPAAPRLAVGRYGPNHDVCPPDCCRYTPAGPPARSNA
jgi:ferrochelatase